MKYVRQDSRYAPLRPLHQFWNHAVGARRTCAWHQVYGLFYVLSCEDDIAETSWGSRMMDELGLQSASLGETVLGLATGAEVLLETVLSLVRVAGVSLLLGAAQRKGVRVGEGSHHWRGLARMAGASLLLRAA